MITHSTTDCPLETSQTVYFVHNSEILQRKSYKYATKVASNDTRLTTEYDVSVSGGRFERKRSWDL